MSNPEKANHNETSGLLLVLGNRNRREDFAYVRSRAGGKPGNLEGAEKGWSLELSHIK